MLLEGDTYRGGLYPTGEKRFFGIRLWIKMEQLDISIMALAIENTSAIKLLL